MPSTESSFVDVVPVPLPFAAQTIAKKRQAVVVSSNAWTQAKLPKFALITGAIDIDRDCSSIAIGLLGPGLVAIEDH